MKNEFSKLSDEDLMNAYQKGDERAFLVLYERYAPKLYGFFQSRIRDRVVTDDLFQVAFLKLHQFRHTYKPGAMFGPWMFGICRNVLIDRFRKEPKEVSFVGTEDTHNLENIDFRRNQTPVDVNLNLLSEREKIAVQGRYSQELSFKEIGKRTGTTESNARQIISRAIKKLKKGFGH